MEQTDSSAWGPGDLYYRRLPDSGGDCVQQQAGLPAEAPQDWDDVLDPRWRDKVLIRDPMASGTMRAIWGLIIERSLRTTGDTAAG